MIILLPNGPSVHSQMALLLAPNSHKKVAKDSKYTTAFTLFTCDGKTTRKVYCQCTSQLRGVWGGGEGGGG